MPRLRNRQRATLFFRIESRVSSQDLIFLLFIIYLEEKFKDLQLGSRTNIEFIVITYNKERKKTNNMRLIKFYQYMGYYVNI
jgi:hypothetical protein